jgi:signal transduction histidine kinase/tetratricopeptide (TPR) repeat protein
MDKVLLIGWLLIFPQSFFAQILTKPPLAKSGLQWEAKERILHIISLDSLSFLLKNAKNDSNKIDILNAISFIKQASSTEQSLQFAQEALQKASQQNYRYGIYKAHWLISYAYFLMANYKEAESFAQQSISIANEINYPTGVSRNYRTLALVNERQNRYDKSLEYYFESLKINETSRNYEQISQDYFRISLTYEKQENLPKSLEYMYLSLKNAQESKDKTLIMRALNWLGYIYKKQKKYAQALERLHKSLKISENNPDLKRTPDYAFTLFALGTTFAELVKNNPQDTSNQHYALRYLTESIKIQTKRQPEPRLETILEIAAVYEYTSNYELAFNYYEIAKSSAIRQNNQSDIWRAKNHLAGFYNRRQKFNQALQLAQAALENAQKVKNLQYQQESYAEIAKAYAGLNNFSQAYQYQVLFSQLRDSLRNDEARLRVARLEITYEFEQKQKRAELERQKEVINQRNQAVYQTYLRNGFIIAFGLVLGLASFIFILYTYQRKTNKQLAQQTKENEIKSRQIQSHKEILEKAYLKSKKNNEQLKIVNAELQEKREEVEMQSEELREANLQLLANQAEIQAINTNLEAIVKERTDNLQKSYAEISQLNTELDNFLYHSSHSLRRPLTTILGLHQLSKILLEDPQAQDLFDKVEITAQNMDKMLHKFLMVHDINELEDEELTWIDFEQLLHSVYQEFQADLNINNIYWQVEISKNIQFKSYQNLLKYIFINLIENSIFFCNEKNAILKIDIRQTPQKLHLKVTDNGEGITLELQNRIFEMFFRANEKSQGNGLGLYVVKKAVERLNGMIVFQSEPQLITEFEIQLPVKTLIS